MLITMATLAASVAVVEVYLLQTIGQWVDWLPTCDQTYFFTQHTHYLGLVTVCIVILIPGLKALNAFIVFQTLMSHIPILCRWRIHRYALHQDMHFYQQHAPGAIGYQSTQTCFAAREVLIKSIHVGMYILVYFFTSGYAIARIQRQLVIPFFLWMVAYLGIMMQHIPRLKTMANRASHMQTRLAGYLADVYSNMFLLTIACKQKHEAQHGKNIMHDTLQSSFAHMRQLTRYDIAVCINNSLFIFTIGATTLYYWQAQQLPMSTVTFTMATAFKLQSMSQWIMWEAAFLVENLGILQNSIQTLCTPITLVDGVRAKKITIQNPSIDFQHVSFAYAPHRYAIKDFTLRIQPGEKIGLIGTTGAGKSTILHLLLRLYDTTKGSIFIDQQPIHQVTQQSLRESIAVVSQHTGLLQRSIRENIAYAVPHANDAEIIHAAKQSCAWAFICGLRDQQGRSGLDAVIGSGVELSCGERQRIALAAMFLKNAPIILLDEATSALDAKTEAMIQEKLNPFLHNKTVISITHQLSGLHGMNRIVLMEQGSIVEVGSHTTLLQNNGPYTTLWQHQVACANPT